MNLLPLHRAVVSTILLVSASGFGLTGCGGGGGNGGDAALNTDACGALGLNAKIVNGTACETANSPVLRIDLQFLVDGSMQSGVCTGTLLTSEYVLTAAHCVPAETVSAQAGHGALLAAVDTIYTHPDFGPNPETGGLDNDIAILKLRTALPLPTTPVLRSKAVDSGDTLAIFGYGYNQDGAAGLGTLRSGEMRVSNTDLNHIVAIFDGSGGNTCNGDSGGPALAQNSSGAWGVIGITSTGTVEGCAVGDVSTFTNLSDPAMIAFIGSIVPGAGAI